MLEVPASRAAPVVDLQGRFRPIAHREGTLILESTASTERIQLLFHGVACHSLPPQLENLTLRPLGPRAAAGAGKFEIGSAGGSWRIEADSVQVHEHPHIFGRIVPLPRFALRRRLLWISVLWLARHRWGRAAIQRLVAVGHR